MSCAHESVEIDCAIETSALRMILLYILWNDHLAWGACVACFWQRFWSWMRNFRWRCGPESKPESTLGGCSGELVCISHSCLVFFGAFNYVVLLVDTEVGLGGDGTGDVCTGMMTESHVRRRLDVVTRRLVPLSEGPGIFLVQLIPVRITARFA